MAGYWPSSIFTCVSAAMPGSDVFLLYCKYTRLLSAVKKRVVTENQTDILTSPRGPFDLYVCYSNTCAHVTSPDPMLTIPHGAQLHHSALQGSTPIYQA